MAHAPTSKDLLIKRFGIWSVDGEAVQFRSFLLLITIKLDISACKFTSLKNDRVDHLSLLYRGRQQQRAKTFSGRDQCTIQRHSLSKLLSNRISKSRWL